MDPNNNDVGNVNFDNEVLAYLSVRKDELI